MIAVAVVLLAVAAAGAPEVIESDVDGRWEVAASFPGWLSAHAVLRGEQGDPEIWAVTTAPTQSKKPAPEAPALPPCPGAASAPPSATLSVASRGAGERYAVSSRPVDPGILRLAAVDLDRDGAAEVVAVRAGAIVRIDSGDPSADRTVMTDAAIADSTRVLAADGGAAVALVERGKLTIARPGDGGTFVRSHELTLPVDVRRSGAGWQVTTHQPELVAIGPAGDWILATEPRAFGTTRLRTSLVRIPVTGGAPVVEDCWSRLPSDEEVLESHFATVDDRPALVVLTKEAGKLALFAEKRLRMFFLQADRTRLGSSPALAVDSGANLWQQTFLSVAELDGDGKDDLALVYWKGLSGSSVSVEVYSRGDGEVFRRSKRSAVIEVPEGDREQVALDDLDGDGAPDLLVRSGGEIRMFRGLVGGKRAFAEHAESLALAHQPGGESRVSVEVSSAGTSAVRDGPAFAIDVERLAERDPAMVMVVPGDPARIAVVRAARGTGGRPK